MSKKWQTTAEWLNDVTYINLYDRYKNIALNRFEWKGLPTHIRPEYVEYALFENGQAIFAKDDKLGYICLPCIFSGGFNIYHQPVKYRAIGFNYNVEYDATESVNMRNNPLRVPTEHTIRWYITKLYNIERTLDISINALKMPYMIKATKELELTIRNMFKQIERNEPAVIYDKSLGSAEDFIEIFQTGVQPFCDKLADYRHDVENALMTFLGINNANTDKRERLLTGEVSANDESIMSHLNVMLDERRLACDEINAMYNDLHISVGIKQPPAPEMPDTQDDPEEAE